MLASLVEARAPGSMITVTSLPACAAPGQRAHDGGVAAGAVQGLLVARTCGSSRLLMNPSPARSLETVDEEHVAGAQGGKDIVARPQAFRNAPLRTRRN